MKFTKYNNPSRKRKSKKTNNYNREMYNQMCQLATGDILKDKYLTTAYNILKH